MDAFPQQFERGSSIKSLSLQDIVNCRPPLLRKAVEIAKTALMIWGAISLSAGAGYATLHLQRSADEPILRSEQSTAAQHQRATPNSPPLVSRANETAALDVSEEATEAGPEIAARLPRARPLDPMITGSIVRAEPDPRRYRRHADPCEAWNSLGMPLVFRCIRESELDRRYAHPQRW